MNKENGIWIEAKKEWRSSESMDGKREAIDRGCVS